MPIIYVARSPSLGKWASDVGLSRHVYKVGIAEGDKGAIRASWAGFADWKIVQTKDCADTLVEQTMFERLSGKIKMLDPRLYPRIRGVLGIFKVLPAQVENYLMLTRALAGAPLDAEATVKPADFADYLLNAANSRGGEASEQILKYVEQAAGDGDGRREG